MKKISLAFCIALAGVGVHMGALAVVDRLVHTYPAVSDILMDRFPSMNLFLVGEFFFAAIILAIIYNILGKQRQDIAHILVMVGIYYAARGVFLLFLPIGAPHGAPALVDRFVFYPYAAHAYFPGGHIGIMFLLARAIRDLRWRRAVIAAALIFGIGTLLTKAHYTADLFGGLLLGYAVSVWGEKHLRKYWTLH